MTNSPNLSSEHAFSQLNEEERARLYRLLLERDFGGFVRAAWPILEPATQFSENWHLDLLAEYLTLVRRREIRRLIINVPPRSMKSLTTTVMFPSWIWATEPWTRFICSSYADSLSIKHSLDRRTLISSPWYQALWGERVKFADDQNLKSEFQNEARGVMLATSTGGGVTGKGCDILIVDDPHNPLQALSDAERSSAIRHFDHVLSTRLDDPKRGAIVVVMQRLHEDDLTGHLLAQQGWEHICLPAEAERHEVWKFPITKNDDRSPRVVERHPGDLLWADRFPQEVLEQYKVRLGSYAYAGQFQQRPSPAEGGILKRSWWRRYDVVPEKFDQVLQSWDFTFKDSKGSDFVVGQVWGRVGANKYLLDQVRGKFSFTASLAAMRTLSNRWPPHASSWSRTRRMAPQSSTPYGTNSVASLPCQCRAAKKPERTQRHRTRRQEITGCRKLSGQRNSLRNVRPFRMPHTMTWWMRGARRRVGSELRCRGLLSTIARGSRS
jgi:hypothetical protein